MQLLADIGLRDGSAFQNNGITGGELLELDSEELQQDLGLTRLQVHLLLSALHKLGYRLLERPCK